MLPKPISPYPNIIFPESGAPYNAVAYNEDEPAAEIVDKGSFLFHQLTKSTLAAPSTYRVRDVCGNEFYMKGGVSFNDNVLVNCVVTPIFQGSLSATIPINMTKEEFDEHIATMSANLWTSTQTQNFSQTGGQIN